MDPTDDIQWASSKELEMKAAEAKRLEVPKKKSTFGGVETKWHGEDQFFFQTAVRVCVCVCVRALKRKKW